MIEVKFQEYSINKKKLGAAPFLYCLNLVLIAGLLVQVMIVTTHLSTSSRVHQQSKKMGNSDSP